MGCTAHSRRVAQARLLGFAVAQSTVAKYMAGTDGRPSGQRWGTFLRNHLPQIAAMDLFVVPPIGFNLVFGTHRYFEAECPGGLEVHHQLVDACTGKAAPQYGASDSYSAARSSQCDPDDAAAARPALVAWRPSTWHY